MNFEYRTIIFEKTRGFLSRKVDDQLLQQQLNKFGQSGWSLASTTSVGNKFQPSLLIVMQRSR
jgi:hypothetical protein